MSGNLRIQFAHDMPGASVEVIAPDLQTVARVWVGSGDHTELQVPSEGSFLRVHLPSGKVVTLQDPGSLDRTISLDNLERRLTEENPHEDSIASTLLRTVVMSKSDILGNLSVKLTINDDSIEEMGKIIEDGYALRYEGMRYRIPCELRVRTTIEELRVRLPGYLGRADVRYSGLENGTHRISVRVKTYDSTADTLGSYLIRGDMYSAASMSEWARSAEDMLYGKMDDPWSATIGAYLLLRLRKFDMMHSWSKNLADRFPEIPDGSIIWAWQQIYQHGDEAQIREYLQRAAAGPLPVFTEGLNLLTDGLRMIGEQSALGKISQKVGLILRQSPFTTGTHKLQEATESRDNVQFDVGYEDDRDQALNHRRDTRDIDDEGLNSLTNG